MPLIAITPKAAGQVGSFTNIKKAQPAVQIAMVLTDDVRFVRSFSISTLCGGRWAGSSFMIGAGWVFPVERLTV